MDYTNPFDADEDLAAAYDAQRAKAAEQSVLYGGLRSGALGLGSSAQSALAAGARLFGADQFAADRERASDLAQAEAAGAGYKTPRLADVDSLGGAVDWASGMVSQQLPLLGTMALSGMLGGAAGAALTKKAKLADVVGEAVRKDVRAEALAAQMNPSVADRVAARQGALATQAAEASKLKTILREAVGPRALNSKIGGAAGLALPYFATTAGDTYSAIRNDPEAEGTPREQAAGALLSGAAQTALGTLFEPVVGLVPSMMRGGAAAAALAHLPRKTGPSAALKALGITAAGEAATETAEQAIQQFTQKQYNPNFEYDPAQLLEAGLAGGLVGGVYSAPGAIQAARQKTKDAANPAARVQVLNTTIANVDAPLTERASAQAEKSFLMANYGESFQVAPEEIQQQFMQNAEMMEELRAVEPKDKVELVSNYAKFRELSTAQESILESLGEEDQTALKASFEQIQKSKAPPTFETLSDEDKAETLARVISGTEQLGMSVPEELRREYEVINQSVFDRNRAVMEEANSAALAARPEQGLVAQPEQGLVAHMTEEMVREEYADPLLDEAISFVKEQPTATVDDVQQRFGVGYNRAARMAEGISKLSASVVPSTEIGQAPTASVPRGNAAAIQWMAKPAIIKPDAVTVDPTDDVRSGVKTIYRRYDVNQDAEKLGGVARNAPTDALFVRETIKLKPNRSGIGVTEVPVQKELLNLSGFDENLEAAAFMLGNKVLVNRPGERPTHLSRRLREAGEAIKANNPDPIDIKELFRLANRDVRESRKHLAPRRGAQAEQGDWLDYAFEKPSEGYAVTFDTDTDTFKLVEEATGNEMLVPGTIDEILGGRGVTYRGEQMQTSGKLRNLISRAYAGNAGRLAYNPDTEMMDVPEARIDIPSMFDLANQSYNFRRMPRPKHAFYVETDADGNVSALTADTNDEAYLRLNPLIEEYGLTPVKIKGDSFQHGFAAAVDYMAKQGQVLVGKMDNQLFFGTPKARQDFNEQRAIEGTGPGSLYDDFNTLERRGVLLKKESGDKRVVDATRVVGRHGEITANGKKTLTHDGVIGIVRGEPLSQGVSRRRVKRDADGNWFFQEDKGILRSPLQKLNGKGEVLVTEAESLNSSLQLGKTRDKDDTGADLRQFNEKDEFEFYPMYPVARQKGGIANLQQILFGAEDPQFLYKKDREEFLDSLRAEGLLSNDQILRHLAGIPLRMLIDENAALKWGVNIRAHTSRAYVMSVTDEMLDGKDLDRAIEEFDVSAKTKNEIKQNAKDEFKRVARREYAPGQDDMLLLDGTYNEINKKWKETHKGEDLRPGDIVLLHRDPALPDASSMSPFVYVGKAKLETSRGSHNRGIVVHSGSEGWNEAAGDFDGDSGVLTVPEKGLYPRAKLRSNDPDPKKAEAINKFTYVRKDEAGKKDPINTLIDRYIADNPDAVVHKDGSTVYEWTIQKDANSPPVDLVGELAKQQASGFSQMIGMIMRPAQKLAEMGALETPVTVKTFDASGAYDGGTITMPVGLLLAKIGQASISAKKKATFSKQALEAFEVAQRLVEQLKPQKFVNKKGRYIPLNRKDTDFGELSVENSWRKVLSALRYSKFKRLPENVQAEVDDAFEALKDYYRDHPNADVRERFTKAEDAARSKYNELTINGFHKFFVDESKISRGRALWTAPAHLLNNFTSIPELHAGGPVNHDYFVSLFAKLDRAPRHDSEAHTRARQADRDADRANGLDMENSEELASRRTFGYDPESGRFYGTPRSKREVWDVMVQQARDVLNTKEAARYPKMFVELAERVMSLNAVYNRIGLFQDAGIPQAFREAALKKATASQDDIEVLTSWKDRIQQIGNETATYDSRYDEDLIEDARAESADIMNEIALAYNTGRISGADIIAYGPASQAVKTLIDPAELQDIAALTDFNKQYDYYVAKPDEGKAVSGMYELNPETGTMTLQEAFDGGTDGVEVLEPSKSGFDSNMRGVVGRIAAGAESFGFYTPGTPDKPGRPLIVPAIITGRETKVGNLVVEVGVSTEAVEAMREWSTVPPLPAEARLIMREGTFTSISNARNGTKVEVEVPAYRVSKDGVASDKKLQAITTLENAPKQAATITITASGTKDASALGTLYAQVQLKGITNEDNPLKARAKLNVWLLGRSAAEAAYNADRLKKKLPIEVGGIIKPEVRPQQQAQPTTTSAAAPADPDADKTLSSTDAAGQKEARAAGFRKVAEKDGVETWKKMTFNKMQQMLTAAGMGDAASRLTEDAKNQLWRTISDASNQQRAAIAKADLAAIQNAVGEVASEYTTQFNASRRLGITISEANKTAVNDALNRLAPPARGNTPADARAETLIQEQKANELKASLGKLFSAKKNPSIVEVARKAVEAEATNPLAKALIAKLAADNNMTEDNLRDFVALTISKEKQDAAWKKRKESGKDEREKLNTDQINAKVLSDSYLGRSQESMDAMIKLKRSKLPGLEVQVTKATREGEKEWLDHLIENIGVEIDFLEGVKSRLANGTYAPKAVVINRKYLDEFLNQYIPSPETKRAAALADSELQDFITKYDAEGAERLENYRKAATDIGRLFGLKNPVVVLSARDMYMRLVSIGRSDVADNILQFMRNPDTGWNGVHIRSDDGTHYMWVSTQLSEGDSVGVLAHELGHGIIEEHLQNADKTTRESIEAEFEAYKKTDKDADFHEWLADSIRNWLVTEEQPRTAAGTWFKSMAEVFKKALEALKNAFGIKQSLTIPQSVDSWLKSLAKTNAQLDVLYGKDPSNKMSISDRMEQRAARFKLWATNPYASGTAALNEMAQEIGRNLGKYLSPSDVTMLQRLVNTQTVRARLTYMLGKDTEASELIQKNTDMAVGYFYALTTTRVMTAPKEVQSLFSKIREALIHRNRMLVEGGESDANEIINTLGARGWQGELSAPENLIKQDSPAYRLYLERSKQYRDGIFGMLQRGTNAYKQVFSWYIDEPYARIQRTGNPALIDAWKQVQESAYDIGGLKRAGMVSRMHANVQIFLREGAAALKGLTEAENNELARYMLTPIDRRGHASDKVKRAAAKLDKLYNDAYTYERDKLGPKVAPRGGDRGEMNYREGYAPMIPNHDYIEANLESVINDYANPAFQTEWTKVKDDYLAWIRRAMGQEGEAAIKEASAEVEEAWNAGLKDFVRFYLKNDGARTLPGQTIERYPTAVAHSPGFRFANPRELGFLLRSTDTNLHSRILNSMNLNPGEVLNMYFRSAVKRMEHERLMANFGENGLKTVFEQAKERGATPQDLRLFANSLLAVQGMLGLTERNYLDSLIEKTDPESSIGSWLHGFHSNKTRIMNEKLSTGLTFAAAWENASHLTLSLAAAAVDPAGSLARSGDFDIFWKSMKETREMMKRIAKEMPLSELDTLLDLSGVMERANTRQDLNATYMAGLDAPAISKFMDVFFRINGVQYLTDFTRAAAGRSAFYAIASWKRMATDPNSSPEIQQKALRELHSLGLTPEDVEPVTTEDGELPKILTYEEWAAADDATKERDLRVRAAIHTFVDQSTVRPDAASRPLVASNPYTALFMQWKSFSTAFGANILAPAWGKLVEEGDATPMMYLALLSIPVMLFADMLRDAVKMSLADDEDEEGEKRWRPAWKSGWSLADHVGYAVKRSGFQGKDELSLDVISPVLEGKHGEAAAEFGGVIASDARKVAKFGWGNFPTPLNDLTKNWGSSDRTERREADYSANYYSGI